MKHNFSSTILYTIDKKQAGKNYPNSETTPHAFSYNHFPMVDEVKDGRRNHRRIL